MGKVVAVINNIFDKIFNHRNLIILLIVVCFLAMGVVEKQSSVIESQRRENYQLGLDNEYYLHKINEFRNGTHNMEQEQHITNLQEEIECWKSRYEYVCMNTIGYVPAPPIVVPESMYEDGE